MREQESGPQDSLLVTVLRSMPDGEGEYGPWWSTPDGQWLYAEISERLGRPVASSVNRLYGVDYTATDVANTAVTVLCQDLLPRYVIRADSPWAYLGTALRRELIKDAGGHFRVELDEEHFTRATAAPRPVTTISEAVALTVAVLEDQAPAPGLESVVSYLAERGASRISHAYSRAAADPRLQAEGLTRGQILAVANAVLGSRRGGASVIAGFLADPGFNPRESVPHRKALMKYRKRMIQTNTEESLVG